MARFRGNPVWLLTPAGLRASNRRWEAFVEHIITSKELDWIGTVGSMKEAQCDTCLRDAGYRDDASAGCAILFSTIFTKAIPSEWDTSKRVCDSFEPA